MWQNRWFLNLHFNSVEWNGKDLQFDIYWNWHLIFMASRANKISHVASGKQENRALVVNGHAKWIRRCLKIVIKVFGWIFDT